MATNSRAAFKWLVCEFCSGRLHVVDVGPTLECEDCGRASMGTTGRSVRVRGRPEEASDSKRIVLTVLVALVGTAIYLLIASVVGSALVELVT